jgi:hypothetical protein
MKSAKTRVNPLSRLVAWFSDWRKRRQYSQYLEAKQEELALEALKLQIKSLRLELKEHGEAKKLKDKQDELALEELQLRIEGLRLHLKVYSEAKRLDDIRVKHKKSMLNECER